MPRYAVGDIQGCYTELRALLRRIEFSADRDRIWFVGDLVNRGPQSLEVLRFVRDLGANAEVVLGNHDLHLLAVALGTDHEPRASDTLDAVLACSDREPLLEWLLTRPLARQDACSGDLLIHAGLVPQWSAADALRLAAEVETQLRRAPRKVLDSMYGNEPRRWDESLTGSSRQRFIINALTRLRFCRTDGTVNLKLKEAPDRVDEPWRPWFEIASRRSAATRIVFGHWSTLGLVDRPGLLGLDTGCVWGGALSARDLDSGRLWQEPCTGYQEPGGD